MRLEITRKADLAVRAMVLLAGSDRRYKAPELAVALDTTPGFVPQVMAPLVRAGWVRSDTGPTGGYVSTVNLAAVNVLQVIEAVDGVTENGRCVVADRPCDGDAPCSLHDAWVRARRELVVSLTRTSLADLDSGAGR